MHLVNETHRLIKFYIVLTLWMYIVLVASCVRFLMLRHPSLDEMSPRAFGSDDNLGQEWVMTLEQVYLVATSAGLQI